MKKLLQELKNKWDIESNWQFVLINIIFAISGSLTVFIRKPVFHFIGISADTSFIFKFILYIVIVTPVYFVLLLIVGTLFGQFNFFWNFEKKIIRRFIRKKTQIAQK